MSLQIRTHIFLREYDYMYGITNDRLSVYHFRTLGDPEHCVFLTDDGVTFHNPTTGEEEFENWDYFETPEDVWSWIQGWLHDILDQEEE